jgi:hypothetical protein
MAGTLAPDQTLDAGEFHAIAASGVELVQGESSIQRFWEKWIVSPSEEQEARSLQIFRGHQVRQQNPGRSFAEVIRLGKSSRPLRRCTAGEPRYASALPPLSSPSTLGCPLVRWATYPVALSPLAPDFGPAQDPF